MTITELQKSSAYKLHHTATRRGYESRKSQGHLEEYKGHFGVGFIHVEPRRDTTQYVF